VYFRGRLVKKVEFIGNSYYGDASLGDGMRMGS
jgi:hypothetical protein